MLEEIGVSKTSGGGCFLENQMKRRDQTSIGKERVLGKGKTLAEVPRQERHTGVLEPPHRRPEGLASPGKH